MDTRQAMTLTDDQRRRAEENRLIATRKRELALARQQEVAAEPPPQSPESKRLRPPEGCESPGDGPPTTGRPAAPPSVPSGLTPQAMRSLSMQPQASDDAEEPLLSQGSSVISVVTSPSQKPDAATAARKRATTDAEQAAASGPLRPEIPFHLQFALLAAGFRAELDWAASKLDALRAAFAEHCDPLDGLKAAQDKARALGLDRSLKRSLAVAPVPHGRVLLYEARACRDGSVQALPVKFHGHTIAHERLGADNLLRVSFDQAQKDYGESDPAQEQATKNHQLAVLRDGISVAGRAYRMFCAKDKLLWFVAVGGRWPTADAARRSLADFNSISTIHKLAARPALAFSQTFGLDGMLRQHLGVSRVEVLQRCEDVFALDAPPEGVLRVVQMDDDCARDQHGEPVCDASGKPRLMTDGCGLVSADVAKMIPRLANGQLIDEKDFCFQELDSIGSEDRIGPLVSQVRLWYCGSLAKGLLLKVDRLPDRTIVVRRSQIKVEGRPGCEAERVWALEVIGTSETARCCRSTSQLVPLLEHLGGEAAVLRLLHLAEKERERVLEMAERPSVKLLHDLCRKSYPERGPTRQQLCTAKPVAEVNMLLAGFSPREEPYLAHKISRLLADKIKRVRLGSFPIPESAHLLGVADPTGSLPEGCVCVVKRGDVMSDRDNVLLYRSPGIHPGDVRKAKIVTPPPALVEALGRLGERSSAIIFPTRGKRSLADEMAGGDLDGDTFNVIWDDKLVAACQCEPALQDEEMLQVQAQAATRAPANQPPEADEIIREKRLAALVHGIRLQDGCVGMSANAWLRVAETVGAGDPRARKLACTYAIALDAGKNGSAVPRRDPFKEPLPPHLRDHKCGSGEFHKWSKTAGQSALARLHAFESAPAGLQHVCPPALQRLLPPVFRDGAPRWEEQLNRTEKWRLLFKEYRNEVYEHLKRVEASGGSGDARQEGCDAIIETYRQKLMDEVDDDQWSDPPLDSPVLGAAAAIYCVTYQHEPREGEQKGTFAWCVAWDLLCLLRVKLDALADVEAGGPKRAIMAVNPRVLASILAPKQKSTPASESQEW